MLLATQKLHLGTDRWAFIMYSMVQGLPWQFCLAMLMENEFQLGQVEPG